MINCWNALCNYWRECGEANESIAVVINRSLTKANELQQSLDHSQNMNVEACEQLVKNSRLSTTFSNSEEFSKKYIEGVRSLFRKLHDEPDLRDNFLQGKQFSHVRYGKCRKRCRRSWQNLFDRKFRSLNFGEIYSGPTIDFQRKEVQLAVGKKMDECRDVKKRPSKKEKTNKLLKTNDDKEDLDSLEAALDRNSRYKQMSFEYLDDTEKQCIQLSSILSSGRKTSLQSFMFPTSERKDCEDHLKKEQLIMVIGQVNSGKTSLINEILGKRYLPTSELPCTARMVHVKYCEKPYVKLLDNGTLVEERKLNKKILHEFIDLNDIDRDNIDKVGYSVEVGLDCELLRRGLQIMDAPGLSENDTLNQRIEMLSKDDLQLMVYIIDGNVSLTEKDRVFLYKVKAKSPNLKILYVCNKVEENEYASSMDCPSDGEEEAKTERQHLVDKGTWTYGNLQKFGLIDEDLSMEDCQNYFAISCLKVRKSRQKNQKTRNTESFRMFLNAVAGNYVKVGTNQLEHAICRLNLIQKRVYDFCISDRFLNLSKSENLQENIHKVRILEEKLIQATYDSMRAEARKLTRSMKHTIDSNQSRLTQKISDMAFNPIYIEKEVKRNFLLDNCRQQIQDFILVELNSEIEKILWEEWHRFMMAIHVSIEELVNSFHPFEDFVRDHLKFSFNSLLLYESEAIDWNEIIDYTYLKYAVKALRGLENVKAALIGWQLDKEWKIQTAKNILDAIDVEKLVTKVHEKMTICLAACNKEFLNCLSALEHLSNARKSALPQMQQEILKIMPDFGSIICATDALLRVVRQDHLQVTGDIIAKGSRSVIYSSPKNENIVIKKTRNPTDFSDMYNFLRLVSHECLLKPIGTSLDSELRLVLLLPRLRYTVTSNHAMTLFDLLQEGLKEIQFKDIIDIFHQLVSAVHAMADKKFRLTDLRPNNIFILKLENGTFRLKVNMLKPQGLEVPYPDGTLPFHFAPERYCPNKTFAYHEVYSLGILLWLMLQRTFTQPPCLKGVTTVDEVKNRVITTEVQYEIRSSLSSIHVEHYDISELKTIISTSVITPDKRMNLEELYTLVDQYKQSIF